jgi:signal transduction histidine kinase/DNA-binding response OmpR family regulator
MKKNYYARLTGKVLLATIAGIITMYTIHIAIERAFEEITTNFENLATPNERLLAVNNLFRDISQLNHSQQAEAASGRRMPSNGFMQESQAMYLKIDSLRYMFQGDSIQLKRLDEIEKRLMRREKLFIEYLELLYMHNINPDIRQLINNLSADMIRQNRDETMKVVKLYETITTTTVSSDTILEEPSTLFQRMFGRGHLPPHKGIVNTETRVDKDLIVVIDTIEIQREESLLPILELSLDSLHTYQLHQLAGIQKQELELINTNTDLTHEIINIIKSVEEEEFTRLNLETRSVFEIAQTTIRNLNFLAVVFITITILLVLLIIIDIFKSNKYRKQLEDAHNKARLESDAKQRFLSNMSHEIRTPLQSIYGYTEHARIHPDQKANIEAIYLSARHLLNVVNEVLDYSKVTSGRITLEKRTFNPDSELNSVVKAMEPLALQKSIDLRYESHLDKNTRLLGDPFRLRQILYNLTGNAIKFTEKGEVAVIAELLTNKGIPTLKIRVTDTGIGISSDRFPRLFEEFSQSTSPESGNHDGTGLGLSIVHKLITLQNGRVEVDSKPGEGTCFTVTIPYEIPGTDQDLNFGGNGKVAKVDLKSRMVMVVDDDTLILNLSGAILRKHEIPHKVFSNGADILEALKNKKHVTVFLDMRMPGISGLELCKRIRELMTPEHDIKIFALTAQVLSNERQAILDNGFDGIIIKPFKESDLLEALGQIGREAGASTILNLEPLFRMTGNDHDKTRLFLKTVIKESREDLKAIRRSLGRKDREKLILLVHRMAGRIGQAGDREYAGFLRELERSIQNETDLENLKDDIETSLKRGDTFIKEVRNWIGVISS